MTGSAAPRPRPARRIGPYEILETVGRGGSAVVYRARDTRAREAMAIGGIGAVAPDNDVALKLIAGAFAGSTEFRARFRQEVDLIRRLRHPHILSVYDSGESDGSDDVPLGPDGSIPGERAPIDASLAGGYSYLVTEYCSGGSLDVAMRAPRKLRNRCRLAAAIATQIGSALDEAHASSVLHRDIKPSNILLASGGRYVLGDFGLARVFDTGTSLHLTVTGYVTGTPSYMAPEQASGGSADGRTDLYGLGVVLFEIIVGAVPFRGEQAMAIMHAQVHQPVPRADAVDPAVPERVADVLYRALAKSREARYPSGRALAAALVKGIVDSGIPVPEKAVNPAGVATGPVDGSTKLDDDPSSRNPIARGWSPSRLARGATTTLRGTLARWSVPFRVVAATALVLALATGSLAISGNVDGPNGETIASLTTRAQAILAVWRSADDGPSITEALMPSASRPAPLRPTVTVRFSQPMDVVSVETNLRFIPDASALFPGGSAVSPVPLDFEWNGQLVVVIPRYDLMPSMTYLVTLDGGARSVEGRALVRPLDHRFTTRSLSEPTPPGGVVAPPERVVPGVTVPTETRRTPVATSVPPRPTTGTAPTVIRTTVAVATVPRSPTSGIAGAVTPAQSPASGTTVPDTTPRSSTSDGTTPAVSTPRSVPDSPGVITTVTASPDGARVESVGPMGTGTPLVLVTTPYAPVTGTGPATVTPVRFQGSPTPVGATPIGGGTPIGWAGNVSPTTVGASSGGSRSLMSPTPASVGVYITPPPTVTGVALTIVAGILPSPTLAGGGVNTIPATPLVLPSPTIALLGARIPATPTVPATPTGTP